MRGDPSRAVRRWIAVATGLAGSGLIAPVGPHAIAASARAYRRFGPTPATLLALSAIRHPGETAVVDERGAVTYRELQRRAEAIAAALYAMADVPPASVGVLCRNHRGFVEAMAAGAQLGAELVFINTELPDAQLRAVLDRHRPDVLIHDDEYSSAVEASGVPGLRVLAWHAAERDAATTPTLDELARTRRPAPPQVRRAVKVTLLTSGTTGIAKGVPRSVEPAALAALAATAMATVRMRRTDRVLVAPPMFHGFGLLSLLGPLALGATVVCRRTFDARQALEDIERERVTVLVAVPVMLQRILAALDADGAPVRELRAVVTGAAPITRATVSALIRRFGPVVVNGYGSTEAGLVAIATPTDLAHAPGSVGRAALGVSVRVLRPDRTPAGAGEAGEIFVRSGLGYEGYTRDANAGHRAKEIIDGHVATGDMGHRDAEGRLFVDGRADDMIVSGGENVFPGEVEDRIAAHPAVADVVVVGVAHAEFGQALHAFLVVAPGAAQPTDAELREFVLGRLERYKVPKRFTVLDAIPRNASGKVLRSDLPAGGDRMIRAWWRRGTAGAPPRTAGAVPVRALAVAALLALVAPIQIASAGADPGPRTGDFYRPPSALPAGAPGAVVRSERFPLALAVPGGAGQVPANATRIMYRSADTHGAPVAVTGTYLEPSAPWRGNGPRPLVAVAPGTQGQGDQCAPSKGFGEIAHVRAPLDIWVSYEVVTAYSLLARGMAVVMTDYYGLGTPAVHDYVNRRSSGQAVLDSIRAANALTGITRPTAIFGYSQGGGAAAAAAELQGEYAPELDVRGTYAGAPPADIRATMASPAIGGAVPGIGGFAAGLLGYVLNGVAADYPEARPVIDAALNPAGKALLAETARQCIGETAVRYLLRPMASFTAGGRSLAQIIDGSPVLRGIIDDQRIGRRTPVAPVLIASGTNDDVIPFGQVRQLAVDWCARGAAVRLEPVSWLPPLLPSTAVGHLAAFAPALGTAHDWLGRRLAGEPAASNCSALP